MLRHVKDFRLTQIVLGSWNWLQNELIMFIPNQNRTMNKAIDVLYRESFR